MTTTYTGKDLPTDIALALAEARITPDIQRAHIVALREAGWTLESIASPLGVSRERVRQIVKSVEDIPTAVDLSRASGLVAPKVVKPERAVRVKVERPKPLESNVKKLLELQPLARQVRANSPAYREEAEEYTRLINYEHSERGVSLFQLARDLGVTHGSLRFRLVRYGYKETSSTSKVYKPIVAENRVV